MLLAVDAGNTSVTVGIFCGKRLAAEGRIPTGRIYAASRCISEFRNLLRRLHVSVNSINGVILSSVVPRATGSLKQTSRKLFRIKPWVLGENLKTPIVNCYRIPSQVGQDRLVNAVAGQKLYGMPAIVVDFGTAVTFDVVSRRGEYLGGLIFPGMEISLEVLSRRAALLPETGLIPPKEFLGRDTLSSMRAGLFFGFGALCDGIVARLKVAARMPDARVIATGGHVRKIAPYCRSIQKIDPQLTLQGLRLVFDQKNH